MEFTGERLHSDLNEYWAAEHYHRYAISARFVKNKVVLDMACGEGYGSSMLSTIATHVTGVDISSEAVEFASKTYKAGNLRYLEGSATKIPLPDRSIDVVVSFETIEHHDKHQEMMVEIKRVLRPNGCLIISSPDKKYYSDIPEYKNPFHVKELYRDEFKSLVSAYFKNTVHFSQKTVYGSLIVSNDKAISGFVEFIGNARHVTSFEEMKAQLYNICVCSDETLDSSMFTNSIFSSDIKIQPAVKSALEKQRAEIIELYEKNTSFRIGKLVTSPFRTIKNLFK